MPAASLDGPKGFSGFNFSPRLEFFLRAGKIQIVEPEKSAIESRRRQLRHRLRNNHQQDGRQQDGRQEENNLCRSCARAKRSRKTNYWGP